MIEIKSINDPAFKKYGRVITEIDFTEMVEALQKTPLTDEVVYQSTEPLLEELAEIKQQLTDNIFGEMPLQLGFCNGQNHYLNALEYHKCSEVNVAGLDSILILGCLQDIDENDVYDTAKCEAFLLPKGAAVEIYGTTLHYAPINHGDAGFKIAVVLPINTNTPMFKEHGGAGEDYHMTARNKWLYGHPEGGLPEGSPMGLKGENYYIP